MDAVSGGVAVTGQREWNTAGASQRYDDIAPAHRLGLDTAA
jgi:hypothetical protein